MIAEFFESDADELAAGADAGFGEELLKGSFNGTFGDAQVRGDLLVGKAFEEHAENAAVTLGQGAGAFLGKGYRLHQILEVTLVD